MLIQTVLLLPLFCAQELPVADAPADRVEAGSRDDLGQAEGGHTGRAAGPRGLEPSIAARRAGTTGTPAGSDLGPGSATDRPSSAGDGDAALPAPGGERASQPDQPEAPPAAGRDPRSTLTTDLWREPEVPFKPQWLLLRTPELIIEALSAPFFPMVLAFQEYRLARRSYDALTNESHTIYAIPTLSIGGPDTLRIGATFTDKELVAGKARLKAFAAIAINGDWTVNANYSQAIAHLNGRVLSGFAGYSSNRNLRYYGIGGNTPQSDERVIWAKTLTVTGTAELFGPAFIYFSGILHLDYLRQNLAPGRDSTVPSLVAGGAVRTPIGFDRTLDIFEGGFTLLYDSRNVRGRTTRGMTFAVDASVWHDINGAGASAVRGTGAMTVYVPVMPISRVLVFSAGAGAATPWTGNDRLPLDAFLVLGRYDHLRGYPSERFRDHAAWWASVAYRYPFYFFEETGVGLSAALFFDIGQAAHGWGGLFGRAPRWAPGFGVRAESVGFVAFEAGLAFSPEGVQGLFRVGEF